MPLENRIIVIHLAGPGGAGKTTIGRALADRLGVVFTDLDEQLSSRVGDISAYLATHGYPAYSRRNVQTYLEVLGALQDDAVLALSSGFMTYPEDIHPSYPATYRDIVANPATLVLMPSFDHELCVAETVRRQSTRPFGRSAEREEQVIRARFGLYRGLPAKQFETNKPVDAVVSELVSHVLVVVRS